MLQVKLLHVIIDPHEALAGNASQRQEYLHPQPRIARKEAHEIGLRDSQQFGSCRSGGRCRTRCLIQQGDLTKKIALDQLSEHHIGRVLNDGHLTLLHDVHAYARLSLMEDGLPGFIFPVVHNPLNGIQLAPAEVCEDGGLFQEMAGILFG